jgi:tetratricopeptide (TPR) repeat protein
MWIINLLLWLAIALAPIQATPQARDTRFDALVRADFFAGFTGDEARLRKAMEWCERVLADNPTHAEALVWHGSGLMFQAGQAFMTGDTKTGFQRWERALEEMSDAVALAPDNVAVLIPRGAALLASTRNMPREAAGPLLEQAVGDYEKVLSIQSSYFDTLGDHPRGELLFGLAEGSARLGRTSQARMYFERLINDVPNSGHAPTARQFLSTGTVPAISGPGCIGCHR